MPFSLPAFNVFWRTFVLLTLTVGSGIFFSEELFGKPARFTHKTVFGVLSWLIFAALLGGRAGGEHTGAVVGEHPLLGRPRGTGQRLARHTVPGPYLVDRPGEPS